MHEIGTDAVLIIQHQPYISGLPGALFIPAAQLAYRVGYSQYKKYCGKYR